MSGRAKRSPFREYLSITHITALLLFFVATFMGGVCRAADESMVRVGSEVEFPPYAFVDKDGQAAGFSVDLMKAVADAMGLHLRIATGKWDSLWNGLIRGEVDVLPIVAKSRDRNRLVDFSLPHTETFDAFFVRKGDPAIASIDGARGKEIVVMRSDAAHQALLEHEFEGRLILVGTIPEGLSLVASGKHDAFLCSELIGIMTTKEHGIKGLKAGPPVPEYKRVFSFAVKKGEADLLEKLNQGLLIVKTNGEYDRIYDKWLTAEEPWPRVQKYVLPAVGAGSALLLLVAVWVAMLQRLVRKRTRELAERNEMLRAAREGLEEEVAQRTSELRQANEALQAEVAERRLSEQKFSAAFANNPAAITLTTLEDGLFIEVNDTWLSLTGYSREEAIGSSVTKMGIIWPTADARFRFVTELMDKGFVRGWEQDFTKKSGEAFVAQLSAQVLDLQGRKTVLSTLIDITGRKQAEEKLELAVQERTAELHRTARLLELTHEAILVRDMESRITYWSRGAEEMYGCSRNEATGRIVHELLQTRFPKDLKAIEAEVLAAGRWEGELVHTTCDGRVITVLSRWALQTEDGTATGILEINSNITEQKNAEQQLRQGQKMEALGTLAGGIAHDFNNMLAAIIGFSELIHDHLPKDSRERHHAKRVLEASLRGRDLVRQMLTFSRKTEEEKKPLRLSSIVKETAKLLRGSMPSTISIRTVVKSESGVILGDPVQIQQVLMNLATNAGHAMREKGGVLDIELSDFSIAKSNGNDHGMEPGLYMRLVVRDTGVGIPADVLDRIFDPFFTTKKQGDGTGLGLSVVLGIVKQCQGHITVESQPGEGTTFSVYFPKVHEEPATEAACWREAIPTGSETILFVDDEEALVEMGEEILAELGYEVIHRTSSKDALALFSQDPTCFDLVITDQTMPEMTGVEMAREMMRIRPDIPVILATGYSHLVDADSAEGAGIKAFVMKPLTKKEIARTVRNVLDGIAQKGATL